MRDKFLLMRMQRIFYYSFLLRQLHAILLYTIDYLQRYTFSLLSTMSQLKNEMTFRSRMCYNVIIKFIFKISSNLQWKFGSIQFKSYQVRMLENYCTNFRCMSIRPVFQQVSSYFYHGILEQKILWYTKSYFLLCKTRR